MLSNRQNIEGSRDANYRVDEANLRIDNLGQRVSKIEGQLEEQKQYRATKEDAERAKNWFYGAILGAALSIGVAVATIAVRLWAG